MSRSRRWINDETPVDFFAWSERLGSHFFRPEMAGRSVVLYVTPELLDELGSPAGATWREFVSVVKAGHPWCPASFKHLCQKALHCCETWRLHTFEYPPYLPYLGLFVLAAGKEGDFAPHAYYPRLRELLGEAGRGPCPGFDSMWRLWEDLQSWANDDKHGDLGTFTARVSGGWVHVGMPLAQTLLTAQERAALPTVFSVAGLDPTSLPPDPELIRLLLACGTHHVRPRTLALLQRGTAETDLVAMLLDIVKEELAGWDGQLAPAAESASGGCFGNLRLCVAVDRVASAARFGMRCSMRSERTALLLTN
jgi:hypothetical protein